MYRSIFASLILIVAAPLAAFSGFLTAFRATFVIAFDARPIAERFVGVLRTWFTIDLADQLARVMAFLERLLQRDRDFTPGLVLSPV